MFLNDMELESDVIFVEDAGPYLLSSRFSLTMTFVSASESHFSEMVEADNQSAYLTPCSPV